MKELNYGPPQWVPGTVYPDSKEKDNNGQSKTPEIILPPASDATNVIPDEVPRRDGPGGE